MSLIVGAVVDTKVILIGETAESLGECHHQPRGEQTPPWTRGVLKLYRLNDTTAFGFANIIADFSAAFALLRACNDGAELARRAQALQTAEGKFDLIIGEIGYPLLRIVRNGAIVETAEGFIGDSSAYHPFKAKCGAWVNSDETPQSDETVAYLRMLSAFEAVLEEFPDPSVAGIITPLISSQGKFRYMTHTKTFLPTQTIPSGELTRLTLIGSASEGCYTGELFCAKENQDLIGFYIPQGGFGVVFPPQLDCVSRAKLLSVTDPAEWMFATKNLFGEPLLTCWLQDHHCMLAGERALRDGRELDAIWFYQLRHWNKVFDDRPEVRDRYVSGYATALYNARRPSEALSLLRHFVALGPAPLAAKTIFKIDDALSRDSKIALREL